MVFGWGRWGSSFSSVSFKKGEDTRAYFIAGPLRSTLLIGPKAD